MMTGPSHRRRPLMGEINIIPLVDVVLVLLIIFMVTAPLLYRGVDVNLPQTKTNTITKKRYVLTLAKNKTVYLNKEAIPMTQLPQRLSLLKGESVYLQADKTIPYGMVVRLIDLVKQAGIDQLGIVTEPSSERF